MDVIALTQKLIQFQSVTPKNEGCLEFIAGLLEARGFTCTFLTFDDVTNLYARYGKKGKNLCFAGHIDVVPPGDLSTWTHPPFEGVIQDDLLYGRGAADMKGGVAASLCAALSAITPDFNHSISFLLTSDEEGPAIHGTQKVVAWLKEKGETIDACLVAEPTSSKALGDRIKVGRRASLTGHITVQGTQGHVAYPSLAQNPIPLLLKALNALLALRLDEGFPHFEPSNLEITSVDVGNPTCNIIPNAASAIFNVRYNPSYTKESLIQKLIQTIHHATPKAQVVFEGEGDPFYTENPELILTLSAAIKAHTGQTPEKSTSGGTSDARFIQKICPVIEFGLCNTTIHKVNECVPLKDLQTLEMIYKDFMKAFFN